MHLIRRTARAALVGLSTLALATACSDTTGTTQLQGRYDLQSVNNEPLPIVTFESSSEREEIIDGWVELDASGRFSDAVVFRTTVVGFPAQQTTDEVTGDYEVNGDEVVFFPDDGSAEYSMIRSGGTLRQSINVSGQTYTFRYSK